MITKVTDRFSRSLFARDILKHLRLSILSGELPSRHRLVEAQLAKEYGVSRGPVRSALHALEQQGLVQSLPSSGGAEVVEFSKKQAMDLFIVRQHIEIIAAPLIIQREDLDLQRLESITKAMTPKETSLENLHDLDMAFHYEYIRLADNWALLQLWRSLSPVISDMLTLTNRIYPDPELIAVNHIALLRCIEKRDLEMLLRLIDEKLKRPKKLILEKFQEDDTRP